MSSYNYDESMLAMQKAFDALVSFRQALRDYSILRAEQTNSVVEKFDGKTVNFLAAINALDCFDTECKRTANDIDNYKLLSRATFELMTEINSCIEEEKDDLQDMKQNADDLREQLEKSRREIDAEFVSSMK